MLVCGHSVDHLHPISVQCGIDPTQSRDSPSCSPKSRFSMKPRRRAVQVCSQSRSSWSRCGCRSRTSSECSLQDFACLQGVLVVQEFGSSSSALETKVGTQVPPSRGVASLQQPTCGSLFELRSSRSSIGEVKTVALPHQGSWPEDTCPSCLRRCRPPRT